MQFDNLRASLFHSREPGRDFGATAMISSQRPQDDRVAGESEAQTLSIPVAAFLARHEPSECATHDAIDSYRI
jgi:hypothetical protein